MTLYIFPGINKRIMISNIKKSEIINKVIFEKNKEIINKIEL
jgi:hypothetical protein